MRKPRLFYSTLGIGMTLGVIGGYAITGDYVAGYSIGFIGLAAGFMAWLVVAYLLDE
jgi:hypothetical protein